MRTRLIFIISAIVMTVLSGCSCTQQAMLDGKKKIFFSRVEGKAKSLDPQGQFDAYSRQAVTLLYDSLYGYHYLKRPFVLVPNLAADMPSYSPDGKVMTIRLRDDVWFQDDACFAGGKGRKFVASDVVYSLKRFADANVNSQGSVSLVEGMIEGFDDFTKKTKDLGEGNVDYDKLEMPGIKALDEHTIEIRQTRPTPVPFYILGVSITSIVPRECVEHYGADFNFHPVGTGPFKLKYRSRKGDMVLVKNPRYHLRYPSDGAPGDAEAGLLADAGKQLPLVDEVVIPVIEENQPAMLKFLRGSLDWVRLDGDSFRDMGEKHTDGTFALKPPYDKKYKLYPGMEPAAYWWAFNLKDPIVGTNVKLRRALAYAMNRQGYIDDIFNGRGEVIDSPVPSTIAGNAKDVGSTWYPTDVEMAKKLLAEAGYPGGKGLPTLKLFYAAGPTIQRQFEYLRREWAAIGVTLELETTPYTAYLKKFSAGAFQISIGGWAADYLDAENFLGLFTKTSLDNELYYGGAYVDPKYEALFAQIRVMANSPERNQIIREMTDMLKNDVPVIPIFSYNRIGMSAPWLKNWKRHMAEEREAVYVDVDAEAQKKGYAP